MKKLILTNETDSKLFYESRYKKNYMEGWPIEKKMRIIEVIKSLNLPEVGEVLDFGCGNGVFSDVLKDALPFWTVYGCDISETAVQNASQRFSNCTFFTNNDEKYQTKKFDFLFTHHVLEHVFDINQLAKQISGRLHEKSSMLHIFPCGNSDSFEYKLCVLRADGININMENRFFYEDEGHIRRMTTVQCENLFKEFNFVLKQDYYSNQYYGAINWITQTNPALILKMFNPIKGEGLRSKFRLTLLLVKMLFISGLRIMPKIYKKISQKNNVQNKHFFFLYIFYLPSKLFWPFENYFMKKATSEWNRNKTQKNGSEMYLYFER